MNSQNNVILIIGASGFVGHNIYQYLSQNQDNSYQVLGTYHSSEITENFDYLDITSSSELYKYLFQKQPDFIIFAAGNKDIKSCESDFFQAYSVNTEPINSVIKIINTLHINTRFIYISTDYVFDGKDGEYRDDDMPNPQTQYGKTKYLAEELLLNSAINYKIIRTGALMGKGGIFFDWLIDEITNNCILSMYDDIYFTPTPSLFFCEMLKKIIDLYDTISEKIIHISGEKRLNRYHFALIVKDLLKSNINIRAEKYSDSSKFFQSDLSLISSDVINKLRTKKFIDYLKNEIINDQINLTLL